MTGRYIIMADDDADDLELLTNFFKEFSQGVILKEFKDGKEVITFLESISVEESTLPTLIVLDINMPRMNGLETLIAIRKNKKWSCVPVVIYTTSMSKSNTQLCKDLDASWIIKPSSIEQVRQTAKILAEFCEIH